MSGPEIFPSLRLTGWGRGQAKPAFYLVAANVFACVWQGGRGGGGGHDDNSSEASARKEQSVCIVDKLGSVRVGQSLGSVAQSSVWQWNQAIHISV